MPFSRSARQRNELGDFRLSAMKTGVEAGDLRDAGEPELIEAAAIDSDILNKILKSKIPHIAGRANAYLVTGNVTHFTWIPSRQLLNWRDA